MAAAVIIRPLSDEVQATLFAQALVGYYKGEPYTDFIRRYTRLVEAEIQGQVLQRIATREADAKRRERRRASQRQRAYRILGADRVATPLAVHWVSGIPCLLPPACLKLETESSA